jgi:hypothetical protein
MLKTGTVEEIRAAIQASKNRCEVIKASNTTYQLGRRRGVFLMQEPQETHYHGHSVLLKENRSIVPKGYKSQVVVPVGAFV